MDTHTLLIVDDSIPTQRVIQLTFANEAIRVVVAANGHQALERIEADRPDIILACTSVPGMDGYAIARHVSRKRHLRKVPVLLLMNGLEPNDEQKVKKSGAKGFLQKPLDPGVVIRSVKHELSLQAPVVERASVAPKPRKTRASKSTSRPKPSARRPRPASRTRRVQVLPEFEAGAITPELLAQNVSDAIGHVVGQAFAHAIAGYQRAHGLAPEPAMMANTGSVVINAASDLKARSSDGRMVVHGDSTVLEQLRRGMGVDDFKFDELTSKAALLPALTAREPADVFPDWSEDLKWVASEIGNVRVDTSGPDSSDGSGTGFDNLPPQALPARLGAWLAARDMRPRIANFGADAIAWVQSGTSLLFEPFRGGQVWVRAWFPWLAGDLRQS